MPGRRNGGGDGRGGRGTRRYPEICRRDAARLCGRPVASPAVGSAVRPRTARREGQPGVRRGAGLPGRRPVRHMPGGRRGDRRGQEDRFRREGPQILPHPALHGPSRRGRAPGAYGRLGEQVYDSVRRGDRVAGIYWNDELRAIRFGSLTQETYRSPVHDGRLPGAFAVAALASGLGLLSYWWWLRYRPTPEGATQLWEPIAGLVAGLVLALGGSTMVLMGPDDGGGGRASSWWPGPPPRSCCCPSCTAGGQCAGARRR